MGFVVSARTIVSPEMIMMECGTYHYLALDGWVDD
jgi:hypothetical protein